MTLGADGEMSLLKICGTNGGEGVVLKDCLHLSCGLLFVVYAFYYDLIFVVMYLNLFDVFNVYFMYFNLTDVFLFHLLALICW